MIINHPQSWSPAIINPSINQSTNSSINQSVNRSINQSMNQSFIRSFIHVFFHLFVRSCFDSFVRSFISFHFMSCYFIHSFIHSFVRSFVHSSIHPFIHPSTHPFIHSLGKNAHLHIAELIWGPHTNAMSKSAAAGSCNLLCQVDPQYKSWGRHKPLLQQHSSCVTGWQHDCRQWANPEPPGGIDFQPQKAPSKWHAQKQESFTQVDMLQCRTDEKTRPRGAAWGVMVPLPWMTAACEAQGTMFRFSPTVRVLHGRLLHGMSKLVTSIRKFCPSKTFEVSQTIQWYNKDTDVMQPWQMH